MKLSIDPQRLRGKLRHDEPMSRHVSWRAGGRTDNWYQPADIQDMGEFLRGVPAEMPVVCVGLGSNLLVRDGGLRGVVVALHGALNTLTLAQRTDGYGVLYGEAGVALPKLARFAANHGLVGAEFMAGIPGTLGGALAMNAGCYGAETWGTVLQVLTINRQGELRQRDRSEFEAGYRHVAGLSDDEWFVAGWLRLPDGDGEAGRQSITALLQKRIANQPLGQPNAGSVFRNPTGDYAARLIEVCGLKGCAVGGARVSDKHANFIVNTGAASATEIEQLIAQVHDTVQQQTGVDLVCEVRIIGEQTGAMQ